MKPDMKRGRHGTLICGRLMSRWAKYQLWKIQTFCKLFKVDWIFILYWQKLLFMFGIGIGAIISVSIRFGMTHFCIINCTVLVWSWEFVKFFVENDSGLINCTVLVGSLFCCSITPRWELVKYLSKMTLVGKIDNVFRLAISFKVFTLKSLRENLTKIVPSFPMVLSPSVSYQSRAS